MAGSPDTGEVYLLQRESAAGKRQGRYVLGELLGRGGMAEVFAGQSMGSHGFQKPVAIKRLLPELANDTVFVERLIGEAKLLVGMQHGNIVSVLDLARDGDDVFLVMEFMDGPSVRQLLKARGTRGLPIGVATYIVQNAATGLEFAHGRPGGAVIHADISPSNILLTTSGEVRVADFGIARREGNGAGIVEGKWAYMAPEQARGEGLTPRSDVFALGVVLYELVTGQHPLGRQVTADERESAPVPIIPPRVVKPSVPVGIDALVMKALSHDPRDRFAKMQQFIDALVEERFANGWREGANDLATVIREVTPGAGGINAGPKTMHTDRPVTIVTRSLISQPQHRPPTMPPEAESIHDSGAQTKMVVVDEPGLSGRGSAAEWRVVDEVVPTARPSYPTQMVRTPDEQRVVDSTPPVHMMALAASMLPAPELASVHGGTFTGQSSAVEVGGRSSKWAFGVLGVAALIGAIAAVTIGTSKRDDDVVPMPADPTPAPAPVLTTLTKPTPVVTPPVAPPPVAPTPVKTDTPVAVADKTAKPDEGSGSSLESKIAAKRIAQAKLAQVPPNKTPIASHKGADATVQVDERDGEYANITLNGQSHDTPGAKFTLAPGTYTLIVRNDSEKFTCPIKLDPGRVVRMHVSLERHTCND